MYNSENHSKFVLMYHFIFVCKYRRPILSAIGDDIKTIMLEISNLYDFLIIEQEVDRDHIHLLIESKPKISPLMICRVLKQQSTVKAWKNNHMLLSKFYRKEKTLWTDGYFVSTIGQVSKEVILKYIQNQG